MSKITYTNKQEATDPNNPIDPIEKFKFEDANEIKTSVNELYDTAVVKGDNIVTEFGYVGIGYATPAWKMELRPALITATLTGTDSQYSVDPNGISFTNDNASGDPSTYSQARLTLSGMYIKNGITQVNVQPGNVNITNGDNFLTITPTGGLSLSQQAGGYPTMSLNPYGGAYFAAAEDQSFGQSPGGVSGQASYGNYNLSGNVLNGANPGGSFTLTSGVVTGALTSNGQYFTVTAQGLQLNDGTNGIMLHLDSYTPIPAEGVKYYAFPVEEGKLLSENTTAFIKNSPAEPQNGSISLTGNIDLNNTGYIDGLTALYVRGDGNITTPTINATTANLQFAKIADVTFDINSTSTSNTLLFLEATPEGEDRTYSKLTTSNGGFQFTNAAGTDLVKIGYDGKLSLGNKSIVIGTPVGDNVEFALPEVGGTLLTDADLGSYVQNYNTGGDIVDLTNATLHIKSAAGETYLDTTGLTIYPTTGGDVHVNQNTIGFNKNGGDTSFSADEFKILFKPVWNKSATVKISDTATGHQEFTLPETTGVLATLNDISNLGIGYHNSFDLIADGTTTEYTFTLATIFPGIPEGTPAWFTLTYNNTVLGGYFYVVSFPSPTTITITFASAPPAATYKMYADFRDFAID